MSSDYQGADAEFMLPSAPAEDISRHECVRRAIERAFPLPSTGAFTDLLAAIDAAPAVFAEAVLNPNELSTSAER